MVQISARETDQVEKKIEKLVAEIGNGGRKVKMNLYRRALVENDLSIHLDWETEKAEIQGSATGLCLSHVLREFGLVSHTVWLPANGWFVRKFTSRSEKTKRFN